MNNIAQPTNKIKQNFWLVKFAPFRTSWRDIIKAGQFTPRDVRSHAARKNLIAMRSGDRALFYHSQEDKAIVGILGGGGIPLPNALQGNLGCRGVTCGVVCLKRSKHFKQTTRTIQASQELLWEFPFVRAARHLFESIKFPL